METRLPTTVNVTTATSAARVTPTQPKVPFAEVMGKTAVIGAEAAMNVLPGGPLMAAALRGGGVAVPSAGAGVPQTMSQSLSGATFSPVTASVASSQMGSGTAPMVAASSTAEGPAAVAPSTGAGSVDGTLAQSQDMNLYYLQIQERVNAENRSFTTMSNVMKAEHETVKTAIGNIR